MEFLRLCVLLSLVISLYGVRRCLDEAGVAHAVALFESGATHKATTERLDVSRSVVVKLWRRDQETDELTRRQRQGRQRMASDRQDRYLQNLALRNRQLTAEGYKSSMQLVNECCFISVVHKLLNTLQNSLKPSQQNTAAIFQIKKIETRYFSEV